MYFLAGYDMITDAGRATTSRRTLKPHRYKQEIHKTKDLSETYVTTVKKIEDWIQSKENF